jgi:hypothetical protein
MPSAREILGLPRRPMVSLTRVMSPVSFDRVFCKNPSKAGRQRK